MDYLGWAVCTFLQYPWSWNAAGSLHGAHWGLVPRWGPSLTYLELQWAGYHAAKCIRAKECWRKGAAPMHLKGMQQEGKLSTPLSLRGRDYRGFRVALRWGCGVLSIVTTAGAASSKAFPTALVAIVFSKAVPGGTSAFSLSWPEVHIPVQLMLHVWEFFQPSWRRCHLHSLPSFLLFCSPDTAWPPSSFGFGVGHRSGGLDVALMWQGEHSMCSSAVFP